MEEDGNPVADAAGYPTLRFEARRWLVRITSGEATAVDADALKRWCAQSPSHARAFAEVNLLWDNVEVAAHLPSVAASSQIAVRGEAPQSRRWVLGAMAASAAAAAGAFAVDPPFGLWPSLPELGADYRTLTAERRDIAMPDGVKIELNTRSSLNIVAGQSGQQIELIAGEAAISCPHQTVLSVLAGGGVVRAADAQFNIRSDAAGSIVTCRRGVVSLNYARRSVSVREGHQASYVDGRVGPVIAVEAAAVMAWREGQLVFRRTPLAEAVDEVNRYRSGRIVLMNETLGRRLVDAKIPIDRVDSLIALIQQAYGAKVISLPGAIVLIS
ncbi:putative FecR [Rhodopseudomonas palustris HaA2]|uniref:Putative FecR n=1 Tax=Rhodopseudomonas palustris (strain HaA2) TaxID=316058 RepID=Q2IXX2_RHOP2|nr:FecR domain-containing protein [Rhodopseudomonas palustris]ABD06938.1 putative FecR [Rhodopseudomonas palustris HaA2]